MPEWWDGVRSAVPPSVWPWLVVVLAATVLILLALAVNAGLTRSRREAVADALEPFYRADTKGMSQQARMSAVVRLCWAVRLPSRVAVRLPHRLVRGKPDAEVLRRVSPKFGDADVYVAHCLGRWLIVDWRMPDGRQVR